MSRISPVVVACLLLVATAAQAQQSGPRHDRQGDALPAGALARMGSSRMQDEGPLVFTPDGATLIAASARSIGFWDAATGKERHRVFVPDFFCRKLLLSPDGKTVACSGLVANRASLVVLLDTGTGKEVGRISWDHLGSAIAFCAGGKHLLTAECTLQGKDQSVQLRDVATGKSPWKFAGDHAVLLAGGKTLASLKPLTQDPRNPGDPTLQLHDAATGKELKSFAIKAGQLTASPDGKLLALDGWDTHEIRVWDVAGEKVVRTFPGAFRSVAFTPDSKAVVYGTQSRGSDNQTIYQLHLANVASGDELGRFPWNGCSVIFAPDGKTMLASSREQERQLALWDWKTGKELATLSSDDPFRGMWEPEGLVVFSPDSRSVASCGAKRVHLWDTRTGKEQVTVAGHRKGITHVAFDPAGKTVLSAAADNTFRWWEVATGMELRRLDARGTPAAIAPDGKTVASLDKDHLLLLDAATGKEIWRWDAPARQMRQVHEWQAVAIAPDGRTVAWGGRNNTIRVLDVATGKELHALEGHQASPVLLYVPEAGIYHLAYAPGGKFLVSNGVDGTVRLWDLAAGKQVWRWGEPSREEIQHGHLPARPFASIADNKSLFLSTSRWDKDVPRGKIFEFDAAMGKERREIAVGNVVQCLAISPDGKTLACSGYEASGTCPILLVDTTSGKEVRRFSGHRERTTALAFCPDGTTLVSASDDATLIVWDLTSPKQE
jgi:WD40 repeat protein